MTTASPHAVSHALVMGTLVLFLSGSAVAQDAVQLSPDGRHAMITKQVGQERWVIVSNFGDDQTVTGNVFFPDGRDPVFVWCEPAGDDANPDPLAQEFSYACFGADHCPAAPCVGDDWTPIGNVMLPGSFFMAPVEECDTSAITNGPHAGMPESMWSCTDDGLETFHFQLYGDGTGTSSTMGQFTFHQTGCGFGTLDVQAGPSAGTHSIFLVGSRARGVLAIRQSPLAAGMAETHMSGDGDPTGSSRGGHLGMPHAAGMQESLCTLEDL